MKQITQTPKIIILCLVLFMIVGIIATTSSQTQNSNQVQQDEAMVVKRGQVTQKEREYSKEYKKLYSYREGRKFSELIERSERRGQITGEIGTYLGDREVFDDPSMSAITTAEFLKKLSCQADAVVVGSVKSKTSHMTEDETFIYTQYEFTVRNILKNNAASTISINNNIEITRPGGLIKLDNRRIRVTDYSYEPLEKNKDYFFDI